MIRAFFYRSTFAASILTAASYKPETLPSEVERVKLYIQQQEEHHRKFDFKTEYQTLLERHGIEFDERYV